jgi:hypothetical protein
MCAMISYTGSDEQRGQVRLTTNNGSVFRDPPCRVVAIPETEFPQFDKRTIANALIDRVLA